MEIIIEKNYEEINPKFDDFLENLEKENYLENYIKEILINEGIISEKPIYISLLFTNNENIKKINNEHRGMDSVTDVISFAYHETEDFDIGPYDVLGDIVISMDRIEEQRLEYGHSFEREFFYIITHGILHLIGYDHMTEEDKKIMREKEELILTKFNYRRDNL